LPSSRDNREPDSNVIVTGERYEKKQDLPIASTEAGRRIHSLPQPENVSCSSRNNREPDSNVIDASDEHEEKQD
jgi:hypothetical protein